MPLAGSRGKWGIGKEAVFSTPVAPTDWPVLKSINSHPVVAQLREEGFRQSMAKTRGLQNGPSHVEVAIAGDVYADTIGFPLTGILGTDLVSGASPTQHALSLNNSGQPPSYTWWDSDTNQAAQFSGCKVSEVALKFAAGGLLTHDTKMVGVARTTTTDVAASFTGLPPVPAYTGAVLIGGSAFTAMTDGQINLKRTVTAVQTIDGTPSPYTVFSDGDFTVDGQFTVVMEDQSLYNDYTAGTIVTFDISWTAGAGATLTLIQLHMTQMKITDAVKQPGSSYLGLQLTFEGVANTTDVGATGGDAPCTITLKNAIPTGRYA